MRMLQQSQPFVRRVSKLRNPTLVKPQPMVSGSRCNLGGTLLTDLAEEKKTTKLQIEGPDLKFCRWQHPTKRPTTIMHLTIPDTTTHKKKPSKEPKTQKINRGEQ